MQEARKVHKARKDRDNTPRKIHLFREVHSRAEMDAQLFLAEPYVEYTREGVFIPPPDHIRNGCCPEFAGEVMYRYIHDGQEIVAPLLIKLPSLRCVSGLQEEQYHTDKMNLTGETSGYFTGMYRAVCAIDPNNPTHLKLKAILMDAYRVCLEYMAKWGQRGKGAFCKSYEIRKPDKYSDKILQDYLTSPIIAQYDAIERQSKRGYTYNKPLRRDDLEGYVDLSVKERLIRSPGKLPTAFNLTATISPVLVVCPESFIDLSAKSLSVSENTSCSGAEPVKECVRISYFKNYGIYGEADPNGVYNRSRHHPFDLAEYLEDDD